MENNLQNPVPEEQFTTQKESSETANVSANEAQPLEEQITQEPTVESAEGTTEHPTEEQVNQEPVVEPVAETTTEQSQVEAANESAKEKPAEEHLENEQERAAVETATNYAAMSRKELLDVFGQLLASTTQEAADTLRKEAEIIKSTFYKLLKQEHKVTEEVVEEAAETMEKVEKEGESVIDELEASFKNLYNTYKQRRAVHAQQLEREKEENLVKKLAIIEELKALLEKQEDLNLTFPAFRALQQHWRETGPVPATRNKEVWDNYQYNVERFYDYVKINNELRDLDLKKNLEAKIEICEKAEELLLETSIINAFNKLQHYHEQWREIGPVARELREQIWERFKNATAAINKRHQDFFEKQKEEQMRNLEAKIALCEKAEEVANTEIKANSDWNELSKELEKLQQIWKTIGFATKKENTKIYERFRAACDKFYEAKREFYGQFKGEMQQNLKLKELLIAQAEELKNSDDWKKVTDKFISLQKQWKEIGPVARSQSNAVWKRFRTACDDFFNRKQAHFSTIDLQYDENLRLKEAIIQEVDNFVPREDAKENLNALKEFQRRWAEIGYVPMKDKERIQNAYRAAIDKQFAALHVSDTEKKLMRFKSRIEDIQQSGKADRVIRTERDKLVQKLRQLESDIAVWENNIGFFAKSKNADMLIADVNKKIEVAKEEIKTVEEKIKLIDKQYE